MNRKLGFLAVVLLACVGSVLAAEEAAVDELWFPVGEEIEYRIYWGVIPIGYSIASTEWIEEDGKKLIAIRFRTRTNKFMDRIYRVDDIIESIVDPDGFVPIRFTKNLKEGRYRCHEVTRFDREELRAYWESKVKDRKKEYDIKEDTRDIVSFLYFARTMELNPGERKQYEVMSDEKLYDVFVNVLKKERVEDVDGDKIPSIKFEPEASFEGLFVRKGRMWMWVAEGEPRVITKMQAKLPVASVKLLLAEVRHRGDDGAETTEEEGVEP